MQKQGPAESGTPEDRVFLLRTRLGRAAGPWGRSESSLRLTSKGRVGGLYILRGRAGYHHNGGIKKEDALFRGCIVGSIL